jgi:hypothetical protein
MYSVHTRHICDVKMTSQLLNTRSMKRLLVCLAATLLLLTFTPTQLKAVTDPGTTTTVVMDESPKADALLARLEAIRELDKSNLTKSEKKELRNEVRTIKAEMKALSGGVYLSATAIIIIAILLVLLL